MLKPYVRLSYIRTMEPCCMRSLLSSWDTVNSCSFFGKIHRTVLD